MPTLEEALKDHLAELIALAQFSELGLFQRTRRSTAEFELRGTPGTLAFAVAELQRSGGPDWKAAVLRLVEKYRESMQEGDFGDIELIVQELAQIRWLAAAYEPLPCGFEPDHVFKNAAIAAGRGEDALTARSLGLTRDQTPFVTSYLHPPWWPAVAQSGMDPKDLAIFFLKRGQP